MRRYLIDTSILGAYLYQRPAAVSLLSPWVRNSEAATSILVYGELVEYVAARPDFARHREELRHLLREIRPHFLTYPTLDRYAAIRRQLRPPHGPGLIGDIDTLIAATGLERNLTVVTADRDFQRVPDLTIMLIPREDLIQPRRQR